MIKDDFWYFDYAEMFSLGYQAAMRLQNRALGTLPNYEDTLAAANASDMSRHPSLHPGCPSFSRAQVKFIQQVVDDALRARRQAGLSVPGTVRDLR